MNSDESARSGQAAATMGVRDGLYGLWLWVDTTVAVSRD